MVLPYINMNPPEGQILIKDLCSTYTDFALWSSYFHNFKKINFVKIVTHKNITPFALMKAENFRLVRKRIEKCKENQRASLIVQLVKNLPAIQETPVQFLGPEDPLEQG